MSALAGRRIAIVDDELSLCRALQRLLRVAGFDVDTFTSGETFLASLDTRLPDCIILDLHMPGMTGLEVQSRLADAHREIPVVVLTGQDSPAARAIALTGGAAAYLRKPVGEDVLLAAITRALGERPGPRTEAPRTPANDGRQR